jgi:hypothetical protein
MNGTMRERIFFIFVLLMVVFKADAQYYYKDVLLSRQNQENWKSFHNTRVREVNIQSIDANNEQTPDFICLQKVTPDFTSVSTFTKSANVPASTLTAFYDQTGRMIKTIDTSDTYRSTTEYTYNKCDAESVHTDRQPDSDHGKAYVVL